MKMINKNRRAYLLLILALMCLGALVWYVQSSHLSLRQYTRTLKENRKAALYTERFTFQVDTPFYHLAPSMSDDTLRAMTVQPFVFLAKGKQTEVYESLDGTYVLRCLATKKASKKKKNKANELLRRALIAWTEIREETGLLAIAAAHPQLQLSPFTMLTSKGLIVEIKPEKTAFFLQKKAVPLKKALLQAMYHKDAKKTEELIASLFSLLSSMRAKGVIDLDGALIRNGNLGVVDNKVILLDVGKLERWYDPVDQTKRDVKRLRQLHHWILSYNSDYASLFMKYQDAFVEQGLLVQKNSNKQGKN